MYVVCARLAPVLHRLPCPTLTAGIEALRGANSVCRRHEYIFRVPDPPGAGRPAHFNPTQRSSLLRRPLHLDNLPLSCYISAAAHMKER